MDANSVPWRVLARSVAQITIVVALLLAAYLTVPVHRRLHRGQRGHVGRDLALATVVVVFLHQTQRINRSHLLTSGGTEAPIIVLAIFLIGFASSTS